MARTNCTAWSLTLVDVSAYGEWKSRIAASGLRVGVVFFSARSESTAWAPLTASRSTSTFLPNGSSPAGPFALALPSSSPGRQPRQLVEPQDIAGHVHGIDPLRPHVLHESGQVACVGPLLPSPWGRLASCLANP